MIEPLPAFFSSLEPLYGSLVFSKRSSASREAPPMSKHSPVALKCPSRYHLTYLFN